MKKQIGITAFYSFLACLLAASVVRAQEIHAPKSSDWISLFNGKDLTGWDIKIAGYALNDNYKNTFVAEDGMLRVKYDGYDRFDGRYGHIYYKQPYSYYRLRFEYRFLGEQLPGGDAWNVRNSGVMLHSQSAASLDKDQTFPVSLEMQFLGGLGSGKRATGNLCSPGTIADINGKLDLTHCIDSKSKTYDGDQWVKGEVIVYGDSIIYHIIEADTVLTYTKARVGGDFVGENNTFEMAHFTPESAAAWRKLDNTPLKEGYIAFQSESHAIDFRSIELLPLKGCIDPKASNFKSYYEISDKVACTYRGKKKK